MTAFGVHTGLQNTTVDELRIAARFADGWNVPFIAPDVLAHEKSVLAGQLDSAMRAPWDLSLLDLASAAVDQLR